MKRLGAKTILGTLYAVLATGIGAALRGPYAEGLHKDLAVGAGVLGFVAAVDWAIRELEASDDANG